MLGIAQWRGLGVDGSRLFSDVSLAQDSESLGVGRHQAVLDPVVDHLDEMPGAVGTAVQVALLGSAVGRFPSRRAWNVADAGRQPLEDWIEPVDHVRFAADHHAVAAFQTPHAAARADIHVVNSLRSQFLCSPHIIDIVRIAPVDESIAGLEVSCQVGDGFVHACRRDHQPDRARPFQLAHEILQVGGACRLFLNELFHGLRRHIEDHAVVASPEEPPRHVGAHSSKADHSKLHDVIPRLERYCPPNCSSFLYWR